MLLSPDRNMICLQIGEQKCRVELLDLVASISDAGLSNSTGLRKVGRAHRGLSEESHGSSALKTASPDI
jgi:hypothetical protein